MPVGKIFAASTLSLLAVISAWADQALVKDRSEIKFTAKQLGVNGLFKQFDEQVKLDPKALDASSVKVSVQMASATMNNAEADSNLTQPVWLGVAQFPAETFESTSIKALGAGKYDAAGKLSIKSVSTDVVVPVALTQAAGNTVATGTLPIQRLTYKVGENEWADTSMVANEVQVHFKLTLIGVDPI